MARQLAIAVWLLGCTLGVVPVAFGQDQAPPKPFAPLGPFVFLADDKVSLKPDGGYVFQHTDGGLVFEAQMAPDIRIVDNFDSALGRVLAKERPRVFAYSAFGTFLVRLRMFNENSNPVRTPSYMPKGTIQLAWLKNLSSADPARSPTDFLKGPIEMWLLQGIPFGHHSNGQNGCLFKGQERPTPSSECAPEPPVSTLPEDVNTENGSFSTNYIRIGLEYRRLYTDGDDPVDVRAVTRREWGIGGNVELNPSGYIGGAISDTLRPLYGPTRFRVAADLAAGNAHVPIRKYLFFGQKRWLTCGRATVGGSITVISGGASSVQNVVAVEGSCLPAGWGGAGLFVRYYRGQDYYNAAFLQNINRLQFGLTFLQGKFLAFPKPF